MEGKLIKTDKGNYVLVDPTKSVYDEGYMLGSSRECDVAKLSLKNCQAIERGYDLYKLAEEEYLKHENNELLYGDSEDKQLAYKAGIVDGFQKALEILGDKKFSEDDMLSFESFVSKWYDKAKDVEEFTALPSELLIKWKSLQQTEWDVTFDPEEKDAEGRLILKRKP